MTLRQKQLSALDISISHWEQNCIDAEAFEPLLLGGENCECCKVFDKKATCKNCPIMEVTDLEECVDTPYYDVANSQGQARQDACLLEYLFLLNVREYLLS